MCIMDRVARGEPEGIDGCITAAKTGRVGAMAAQ